ncbi:6-phosphogluconolactonase [Planctomycetes bacterium CA13]|uniref:6-phosphogluconolactonase n=1 Tax=Novipirellula herctigrandis TaxID=2527986 RepID=A0A5C5Z549_9BACT|nr:6-phosphogluconolactonase [Planctomycetes bacterium CA13]
MLTLNQSFSRVTFLLCLFFLLTGNQRAALSNDTAVVDVWIGTSSAKPSKGIYHCSLDTATGKLTESELVAEINGPGFLALHPNGNVLYAVGKLNGTPSVVAYRIEQGAKLALLNSLPIGDGDAAHVSVDSKGKMLLTAQYGSGSTAAFSLNQDGSLKERTALMKHEGGSQIVANRQARPHAHWTGFSPDEQFAFVPDLGLDKVVIYKVDTDTGTLSPHGFGQAPLGGGPRHMKFHNNGKWIYVLNELDLSVTVFDYDAERGTMMPKQTIPTVSKSLLAKELFKSSSEIRVHPSGKFVYAANRGHDTITAMSVDPATGELSVIELENIRGATPRNFNIDPTGKWVVAAGQDSHTLACFAIEQGTGELTYNQSIVRTPAPICVLFGNK